VIDIDKLRAHTRAELGRWNVPAVELAIVKDGKVVLAEGIGRRDVAKNLPATPKTRFHHGSTGKAFTGVLAGTLVDAGLLEWDRPIREYLPEFRVHDRFLSDGELDGRRVLKSETLAETKRPRTPADFPGPDPDIRFHGYAFGWMIGTYRGRRLVWHNGGIDGFHTEIALLPDDRVAVAASSNILQTNLPVAVVFHCIDTLLGEKPKPWSKNLRAEAEAAPAPQRPRVVTGTQPSHPLEEYAGEYEHPGYGTLQVSLRGKGLRVQLSELDVSTKHRHFDTWTIGYAPLGADWPLTFLTDADGQVSAAEMPLEPTIKPIRFERGKPPQTAARDAKT
jgi:Beta-lactamase/Domain of unknown function (DUF3471)